VGVVGKGGEDWVGRKDKRACLLLHHFVWVPRCLFIHLHSCFYIQLVGTARTAIYHRVFGFRVEQSGIVGPLHEVRCRLFIVEKLIEWSKLTWTIILSRILWRRKKKRQNCKESHL
jgi:hypothetical protein